MSEVEDIYLPYKEKKKTRATEAKRRGLEPLAEYLLSFPKEGDVIAEATKYVTVEPTEEMKKEGVVVKDANDALQGAQDIIAEIVSDEPKYRRWIRRLFQVQSSLASVVKDVELDEKHTYEMYYSYQEPLSDIKHHRILAINRGEAEKVLKVGMDREDGFLYYIDKDGDIARVQMARGGKKGGKPKKVEKYCKETNFNYDGIYSTWGPYGFTEEGIFEFQEYYPNALEETYKGVSGYIYKTSNIPNIRPLQEIKDVYITDTNTIIEDVEYINDAYEEILKYEKQGLIKIVRYEEFIKTKKEWLHNIIQKEYDESNDHPEYKYFLKNKFPFIKL